MGCNTDFAMYCCFYLIFKWITRFKFFLLQKTIVAEKFKQTACIHGITFGRKWYGITEQSNRNLILSIHVIAFIVNQRDVLFNFF